jgi:hypothetical protein
MVYEKAGLPPDRKKKSINILLFRKGQMAADIPLSLGGVYFETSIRKEIDSPL